MISAENRIESTDSACGPIRTGGFLVESCDFKMHIYMLNDFIEKSVDNLKVRIFVMDVRFIRGKTSKASL